MPVNLKTRSGNRIVVLIGNLQVGLIQNVRMNDDYAPEPVSGIGDIHVVEHVPTIARHSISVQTMVLNLANLRTLGLSAENGDDILQGLVMDFVVISKDDGSVLRKYTGCSYASGSTEISKHAIVMADGQFLALDVSGQGV